MADTVRDTYALRELLLKYPNACYMSALKRDGIPDLMERIEVTLRSLLASVTLQIPYDRSDLVAQCYENGRVHSVGYGPDFLAVRADFSKDLAGRIARFTPDYVPDIYLSLQALRPQC